MRYHLCVLEKFHATKNSLHDFFMPGHTIEMRVLQDW